MAIATWNSPFRGARLRLAGGLTQAAADQATTSDATFPSFHAAIQFSPGAGFAKPVFSFAASGGLKLHTLANFTGADGANPYSSLIADASGDLFGTTQFGGADGEGSVFEIVKTARGYASAPTTLVSFTRNNGTMPRGSLIFDAAGDLFGTTAGGGPRSDGTVFEIVKTAGGYASAPTTLVDFTGANGVFPNGGLIADAAGNLFGTTNGGGAFSDGTLFEIVKTAGGYANAPTTLVSFMGTDGVGPASTLIADAAGDLLGTTSGGGSFSDGTVFEIAKTAGGYANAPTTLCNFEYTNGGQPLGSLIADAAGDLFGTTAGGGANQVGTVFEIAKTGGGYASNPTVLVNFTGTDGKGPVCNLIIDAAGDLFGTTSGGGAFNDGTVFEIVKTTGGYANAPTTLINFTGADGANPYGSLIADAAGHLFGTTQLGGANGDGTVFKITHTGFVTQSSLKGASTPAIAAVNGDITHPRTLGAAFVQAMATHGPSRLGSGLAAILDCKNEKPTLLSRPQLA